MKRCVIIGGAKITRYENIKKYLTEDDYFIVCDSGLKHIRPLGIIPDLIVGDFDSHKKPENTDIEIITLPTAKDDTDTFFGAKEGLRRGFDNFLLIGVTGQRLDHTLANISVLQYLYSAGKKAMIIDDYSEMEIISDKHTFIPDSFSYFSVLSLNDEVRGIYEKNVRFPLENATISSKYQYGVSNEVLSGQKAEIWAEQGNLLLIRVY